MAHLGPVLASSRAILAYLPHLGNDGEMTMVLLGVAVLVLPQLLMTVTVTAMMLVLLVVQMLMMVMSVPSLSA